MILKILCILLLPLSSLLASEAPSDIPVTRVEDVPLDFPLPSKVWDQTLPQDPNLKAKPIVYGSLFVRFREKNPGVLLEKETIFELPSGGGQLDLSQIVSGKKGSFYVSFDFPAASETLQTKVFFLSESRQRKVEGEIWGSGCRKILELTSTLAKRQFKNEIMVNTLRDRHVSILAGHFIFLSETESSWTVSQVSMMDSNRKDLICNESTSKVNSR